MKIELPREDYWKLRALCGDTQRLQVLMQAASEQLRHAQAKQEAYLADLALERGFLEKPGTFHLDDETLTLNIPETVTT